MYRVAILLFGCLCLHFGLTEAAPKSFPKWVSPCGKSDLTFTISPAPIDLQTVLDALKKNIYDFIGLVSEMKAKYVPPQGRRLTSEELIQSLEEYDIPGLSLTNERDSSTNVTSVFLEDYESFSRIAVFLEQVLLDEANYEFGEYLQWMKRVEDATYLTLCNLHIAIHSVMNSTIFHYVDRDVMGDSWRKMEDRAHRSMRDYIIFHKAEHFGYRLQEEYELLSFRSITK